jgi:hypothetical protein
MLRGGYAKISEKIIRSGGLVDKVIEINAIFAFARKFSYNRGNLMGSNSGRVLPKSDFCQRSPRLPPNLSLAQVQIA